ncbi:MAG: glycosyltransferase family 4 protein [Armatimonadota bacterium]|nr:glycosyltransferase family 4 protein [Armatimonadota bacterium]MDR7427556.1 glycosyltransferase family 4 protein [Armatimonadota bacterium]MDR7463434.1 glycosyltransferase family 4 protein [Armatimonadota bacterium]MDR7469720.1 glycosyltransferase family 4 protein [Armatimonadota bacterium]MDR7473947.1 glycosyltransferase family 4 protein [Armatimonadota bacterium]
MKDLRLLLAVTLGEWGGAQRYVEQIALAARNVFKVTVVCGRGGALPARLAVHGISAIKLPDLGRFPSPWGDTRALVQLVRILRQGRFNLLHANSTKAGLMVRAAAALVARDTPVVFTAHGWAFTEGRPDPIRKVLAYLERWAAARTSAIICVSEYDRALAARLAVADLSRMRVIYNGVDPSSFDRLPRKSPHNGRLLIVMVGRLRAPKDPFTLVEAVRLVPGAELVIVGGGPMRRRVEALARRKGLGERVRVLGFREDVTRLLADADVFALPTYWEGMPLAVIEAMMAGLPVIASRVGGIPEAVQDGVTGLLVPPRRADLLAQALETLRDPELRSRMGEEARRVARERFTVSRMTQETLAVYEELLGMVPHVPARGIRRH